MVNRVPFALGEWYHCYTRGVEKRKTFQTVGDYHRFQQVLYLANSSDAIHRSNLRNPSHEDVLALNRGESLVSIGAYCLMPNHFHILMQETREGGIARFMQKAGTSYAMYFNIKNERVGNLFVTPFRSRHVRNERYLKHLVQYIHLNAAELFEANWKTAAPKDIRMIEKKLRKYPYSSLPDYYGPTRPEDAILDDDAKSLLDDGLPSLPSVLADAADYYRETGL